MLCFIFGILFIIIQFQVDFSFIPGTIEILPSFIGYYFIFKGAKRLGDKSHDLKDIQYLSLVLSLFTLTRFGAEILALDYESIYPYIRWINSIVVQQLLPLFITYKILWGIINIGDRQSLQIHQENIKVTFLYNVLVSVLVIILHGSSFVILPRVASFALYLVILYYIFNADCTYSKCL